MIYHVWEDISSHNTSSLGNVFIIYDTIVHIHNIIVNISYGISVV